MTYMLDRLIANRIRKSKKHLLLLGARQVGKSTLIASLKPNLTIHLADESLYHRFAKDPGRLKQEILALKKKSLIAIDEIQRIPSLLNTIQALIDQGHQHRFLLTGSSARKLKRGGANLLPGRIILNYLDPLSIWELGKKFNLNRSLSLGNLPGVYLDQQEGAETLSSYATVYLREEIQAEALVRNVGDYARFLDIAAQVSGQWVNYSKLASDAEIPKETIRRYFTLLEDTLLIHRLNPFRSTINKRHGIGRDRFIFFDMGVRNALLGLHDQVLDPIAKGQLFEQWFILQLIIYNRAFGKNWRISSFRNKNGQEVDCILQTHKKLIAIECKLAKTIHQSELKGLIAFQKTMGSSKKLDSYIIYHGENRQKLAGNILAIPYREFLMQVVPQL